MLERRDQIALKLRQCALDPVARTVGVDELQQLAYAGEVGQDGVGASGAAVGFAAVPVAGMPSAPSTWASSAARCC